MNAAHQTRSPVFAFAVPVGRGHTKRLRKTLASLRAQSVRVLVALCDAGDSDHARSLAKEFSDIVVYTRFGPDTGQSNAINEGWQALEADIYGWLNADDVLAPGALSHVAELFSDPTVDVVYGQSLITDEYGAFVGLHPAVTNDIELITRSNIISQPSCFFRKSSLSVTGLLDERLHYVMDWNLWVRFYKADRHFRYTPEILSSVVWETGTKTSSVNHHRMREIRKLTGATHNWFVSAKTELGFRMHHAAHYSRLSPVAAPVIRVLKKNGAAGRTIWLPENDETHAPGIFLHHYDEDTTQDLKLVFKRSVNATIVVDGAEHVVRGNSEVLINSSTPAATQILLTIRPLDLFRFDLKQVLFVARAQALSSERPFELG